MIIGCSFFALDEKNKMLHCSGFCESAEMCAQRLHLLAPFDAAGYRSTGFEDDDDRSADAILSHPGLKWYRAIWSTRGFPDRELIVAVKEYDKHQID